MKQKKKERKVYPMKTPKITKLLSLAMALMMLSPMAFAAESSQDTDLSFTLDYFINITKENEQVSGGTATVNDTYTQITGLTNTMAAGYKVITNTRETKTIYMSAVAPSTATGGETNALYASDGNYFIVFSNTNEPPSENDIKDITGGAPASYATNANAFSFPLTVTATADTEDDTSAATADPSIEFANNKIQHELENGIYHFLYTVGTTSENNTFSTHDTNGVYQATITLTDASS